MKRTFHGMAAFWGWTALLALTCAWPGEASANPLNIQPVAVGDLRELQTAPAPGWVRPGMRLTYYSALANVSSGEEYWELDESGGWRDPRTGQRYTKKKAPDEGCGAGHGYTQVNVVSMDGRRAVLEVRAYSFPKYQGPLALVAASSEITHPGFGLDWWANPGVLRRARTGTFRGLTVLRMNHDLGGGASPALRIEFAGKRPVALTGVGGEVRTGELKSRNVLVYGLDNGVLLYGATAGPSPKGATFTHCMLKNSRNVSVPWAGQAAPAWVGRTRELSYTGTVHVPYGARPTSKPISVTFTLLRRGRDWAQFRLGGSMAGPIPSMPTVGETRVVTGSAQFGGLWIPPAALRALRTGQVLDRDPMTKVSVTVSKADRNFVVLSQTSSIQRIDYKYQRSNGLMVRYSKVDRHQYNITTTLRFAGWR